MHKLSFHQQPLDAIQDYQISGLAPLARGYGSQLPTELGLFQSTHDTAFSQMQGVTNDSYGKMQLAAKGFFDDVGMQANQVLGILLTWEFDKKSSTFIRI